MNVFEKIKEKMHKASFADIDEQYADDGQRMMFLYDAISTVDEVAQEYNNGWIPCSERLPETEDDVLVWYEYFRYGNYNRLFQTMGISFAYNGEWSGFVNGQSGWHQLRIIAWQPLPAPYKEGGM